MANATRVLSLLLVLLFTCTAGQAQHRWVGKDKHWYTDWLWWVGEGLMVTAFVLDGHSTALARDRCPACQEANPFVGPHPSNRAIITVSSIFFGIETGLHIASWEACPDPNREFKSWYIACDTTIPAITAAFRIPAIVHNYHVAAKFPSTQSLSRVKLGQAQSAADLTTRVNPWPLRRNIKPFVLPSLVSGCDRSLPLCRLSQPLNESRMNLRPLQFRNVGAIARSHGDALR
jgi:hypothetical protein